MKESPARNRALAKLWPLLLSQIVLAQASAPEDREQRRLRTGREQLARLDPKAEQNQRRALDSLAPDMVDLLLTFGFSDILSRPGLALPDREIATLAALASFGNAEPQLRFHVGGALNVGITPREVVETIYVTTVFAGFPAGLNALTAAGKVFEERGVKPTPLPAPTEPDRRKRGLATMEATSKGSGKKVLDSLNTIAPDMANFILEFSYGDVLSRQGLSPRRKEIAIIAGAIARGTMRPQLMVHVKAGLNVGLTRQEIVEIAMQMAVYAGFPASLNGLDAVRAAFAEVDAAK
jgi:4-carboxymuconolactone decarboxylase